MNRRKEIVSDFNLVRREIYNPNNFVVTFVRMPERLQYVLLSGIHVGPWRVELPAKGRCILNHSFYKIQSPLKDGEPIELITIFGERIGKGETKPSRLLGM
jgi:hypothetical protein